MRDCCKATKKNKIVEEGVTKRFSHCLEDLQKRCMKGVKGSREVIVCSLQRLYARW